MNQFVNKTRYLSNICLQIERITLAEERNRLSSELHDTVGHAYTSIIMGMETLRTELATEMGIQRLDSLLEMGRKSIEDVRGYLHQMDSPCQSPSLIQSLQNLGAEFQEHAQVNVSFRTFGGISTISASEDHIRSLLTGVPYECSTSWSRD